MVRARPQERIQHERVAEEGSGGGEVKGVGAGGAEGQGGQAGGAGGGRAGDCNGEGIVEVAEGGGGGGEGQGGVGGGGGGWRWGRGGGGGKGCDGGLGRQRRSPRPGRVEGQAGPLGAVDVRAVEVEDGEAGAGGSPAGSGQAMRARSEKRARRGDRPLPGEEEDRAQKERGGSRRAS